MVAVVKFVWEGRKNDDNYMDGLTNIACAFDPSPANRGLSSFTESIINRNEPRDIPAMGPRDTRLHTRVQHPNNNNPQASSNASKTPGESRPRLHPDHPFEVPAKTSARAAWRASRIGFSSFRPGPPLAAGRPETRAEKAWKNLPAGPAAPRKDPSPCNPPFFTDDLTRIENGLLTSLPCPYTDDDMKKGQEIG